MKNPGDLVQVISVRPGERMYGSVFKVQHRTAKTMGLQTKEEPGCGLVIQVLGTDSLHNDQLTGPPLVEILETHSVGFMGRTQQDSSRAYFYELGDNIYLILT